MSQILLDVPYFSQRDSAIPGQAHRMCYSSVNAMLLKYLKPTALPAGPKADDDYLRRVLRYGDTTQARAQIYALESYGLKAQFRQDLTWADIDSQLEKGVPVPIGILCWGHIAQPKGGGHWILLSGRTADGSGYYVHDPYGELALVRGYYLSTDGKAKVYSKRNLTKRWQIRGLPGWGIIAPPQK